MNEPVRPKVGLGVVIIKNGKVLFGLRKGSHGGHDWATPGGHLEFGESFVDCARREIREETGLEITNIRLLTTTNDIFGSEKHYITIHVIADWESGEAVVKEPKKCEKWDWFDWDNLPTPLFLAEKHLIEQNISVLLNRPMPILT